MKKSWIYVLVMIVATAAASLSIIAGPGNKEAEMQAILDRAHRLEEGKYYRDAISEYREYLKYDPENIYVEKKIAINYLLCDEMISFEDAAREINSKTGGQEDMYAALAEYYASVGDYTTAHSIIKEGQGIFPEGELLEFTYNKIKAEHMEIYCGFEAMKDYMGDYAVAETRDGELVISDVEGDIAVRNRIFTQIFDYIQIVEDDINKIIVSARAEDGIIRYYDSNGTLRYAPEGKYEYLGCMRDGYVLAVKDGKWFYLNRDFEIASEEYEEATNFSNGVACVKKGDKWGIISSDGLTLTTDYVIDSVVMDDYRCCSIAGVIWVKIGSSYCLVDTSGKVISDKYDEAKPFLGDGGVAAVRKGASWGLVDVDGNLVLPCEYDNLSSSQSTLVAFSDNGMWGYIDVTGDVWVPAQYEAVLACNAAGNGFVRDKEGWMRLQFYALSRSSDGIF